jgi:DNA-binding transcriptional LysR family regulator
MVSILDDGVTELDAALAAEGLSRRIALTTPHFMAALAAVAKTDLVITLSRSLAQRFAAKFDLILRDPPIKDPDFTQTLVWLQARGHDPLMHWLREVMVQEAQGQATAEAAMAHAQPSVYDAPRVF